MDGQSFDHPASATHHARRDAKLLNYRPTLSFKSFKPIESKQRRQSKAKGHEAAGDAKLDRLIVGRAAAAGRRQAVKQKLISRHNLTVMQSARGDYRRTRSNEVRLERVDTRH